MVVIDNKVMVGNEMVYSTGGVLMVVYGEGKECDGGAKR